MSFAINELLTPINLSKAYTKLASLGQKCPLLDFYSSPNPEQGEDFVELVRWTDSRTMAPINAKGAPARTLQTQGGQGVVMTPIHVFNEFVIPQVALDFLRVDDSPALQDRGMQEVRRQMEIFSRRHKINKAVSLGKLLGDGIAYFDANGMILESSSGAAVTVDLSVGATHKSQLAHASNGSSDIIGTAWDNPAASILTDLEQIRTAAEYDMAPVPKHVWLHGENKGWIVNNTEIKAFVQYNNPGADNYLRFLAGQGDTLSIGDWTFHFYSGTYVGADESTVRPLISKTKAIITPDPNDSSWFAHYECAETIPTGEGVIGSLEEYFGKTQKVYGDFTYAKVLDNPLKVVVRMGMNYLFAMRDPNAIWIPTVDF